MRRRSIGSLRSGFEAKRSTRSGESDTGADVRVPHTGPQEDLPEAPIGLVARYSLISQRSSPGA